MGRGAPENRIPRQHGDQGGSGETMKFGVLALDYDGTIARDGTLEPAVREALLEARARGVVVALVTGRILSDLLRAAGNVDFADAVVAENGAVVAFPPTGRSSVLGPPPPASFLDELSRRGVAYRVGECVVEADASCAHSILDAIHGLELPLTLCFNRGRVMVLPQSISKSLGLHEALASLRISLHNTIAIGDAENDHDLLAACEIGVAVEWGSAALKAAADEVLAGDGPEAVAGYVRGLIAQPRLAPQRAAWNRFPLGYAVDGTAVFLQVPGATCWWPANLVPGVAG